jgi:hypothetical protein
MHPVAVAVLVLRVRADRRERHRRHRRSSDPRRSRRVRLGACWLAAVAAVAAAATAAPPARAVQRLRVIEKSDGVVFRDAAGVPNFSYATVIRNPNRNRVARNVRVTTRVVASDGRLLAGPTTDRIDGVPGRSSTAVADLSPAYCGAWCGDIDAIRDARVKVSVRVGRWQRSTARPFVIKGLAVTPDTLGDKRVDGQVCVPGTRTEFAVAVLFDSPTLGLIGGDSDGLWRARGCAYFSVTLPGELAGDVFQVRAFPQWTAD